MPERTYGIFREMKGKPEMRTVAGAALVLALAITALAFAAAALLTS